MIKKIISVLLSVIMILSLGVFAFAQSARKLGDVNNDGKINSKDAKLILRVVAKLETFDSPESKDCADVTFDGRINSKDAKLILRVVAKLEAMPQREPEDITKPDPGESDKITFNDLPEDIKGFINRTFSCDATMVASGESNNLSMIIRGDEYAFTMALSDKPLSIMKIKNPKRNDYKYYLANPVKKTYVELSNAVMLALGIKKEDFDIPFGVVDKNNITIKVEEVESGLFTDYVITGKDSINHFYMKDGKLVKLMNCDLQDNLLSVISFRSFTSKLPSDALSLDAYKKSGLLDFFKDMV